MRVNSWMDLRWESLPGGMRMDSDRKKGGFNMGKEAWGMDVLFRNRPGFGKDRIL